MEKGPSKKPRIRREYLELLSFSAVGLEMGFAVAIGLGIGYYLDKFFVTTKPWLTFIFMFLGIAAAFNSLYRAAREAKKRLDQMERERQEPEEQQREEDPGR